MNDTCVQLALSILAKDFKFAPSPKRIPVMQIVAEVESAISRLEDLNKAEVRRDVTNILRNAKLPKYNLSREERKTIKDLKSDKDILILKADKGNKTVIMGRNEYDKKLFNTLNDQNTYKVLEKDPRKMCETNMKRLLSSKKEKIDQKLLKRLTITIIWSAKNP